MSEAIRFRVYKQWYGFYQDKPFLKYSYEWQSLGQETKSSFTITCTYREQNTLPTNFNKSQALFYEWMRKSGDERSASQDPYWPAFVNKMLRSCISSWHWPLTLCLQFPRWRIATADSNIYNFQFHFIYVGSIEYWKFCGMDKRKTCLSYACEVGWQRPGSLKNISVVLVLRK